MTKRANRALLVGAVAMVLILGQAALRAWWIGHSWYLIDDYVFLADIARGADDLDWYLRIHQGHFMPLSFVLVKLVATFGGTYDWSAVTIEIVALQVVASLTCWWMLRTLFGPTRAALAGLAVYLTSALTMPSIMWWAVAINHLPHQIAFFGAITAHVLFARTRHIRWVLVAGLFLLVGYTSYAKTGLIVVTLVLLTLIWLVDGAPWHRFWAALRRFWFAWTVYGVLSVAWLVVYVSRPSESIPERPSAFLQLAQSEIFRAGLPTMVGGPWRWDPFTSVSPIQFAAPPTAAIVLATLGVVLVLVHAWGTRARALLVLWPLGLYFLASVLLVYVGRAYSVALLGAGGIGRHVQYLSDITPLLVLSVVALYVPVRGVADPIRLRDEPVVRLTIPRWLTVAVVGVVVIGGIASSAVYAQRWRDHDERTANEDAIAALRNGPVHQLVDGFVPTLVLAPIFGERALIKNYFAPVADQFEVNSVGVDLQLLDQESRLTRADVTVPADGPRAPFLATCREVPAEGATFKVPPAGVFGLWLAIDYRSSRSGELTVVGPGEPTVGLPVPAGSGHRVLIQAPQPAETVRVYATGDPDLCVERITYGLVGPG